MTTDTRISQKDLYGFPVSLTSDEVSDRVRCFKKCKKRQARDWAFETAHRHIPTSVSHEDMKRRCRKNEAHEGHVKQIELDVPRTFPEHAFFKSRRGQRALTMTLRALAVHMPDIGYCQSLNYVAGLLLLVLDHDPEDAFWVLVVLIENKLVTGTYDTGISGCLKEVRVLEGLLQRKMPAVSKHLRKRDVDLIAVVPQWFLSLFSQDFPFETAVRVFDALLFEGSKVLHRVALAMFKLTEPRLLQASDTMAAALSLRSAALRMHNRDLLMRTAVRRVGPLSQATIDKLRTSQQPDGVVSSFLSRFTATRKPAKTAPWQSLGSAGIVDYDLEAGSGQDGMIGTAKSSAMRPDIGGMTRRHSSSGLGGMQQPNALDRRSVDAPPPVDLLASMGGIGLLDTNPDASSTATSPRSVQHGHMATVATSVDSHDPRAAQLMQVQAVLDHASIRREMEFTHAQAFNFTQVKVVKVAEAAKLSVRSPLLEGDDVLEEDAQGDAESRMSRDTGEVRARAPQMSSLPIDLRLSNGSSASDPRPRRAPSLHGDVRALLAAADERAAAAASRGSMMHDRSSGGTGGTEGSPLTYNLPYPPSHGQGSHGSDMYGQLEGGGLQAVLQEAATTMGSSTFDDGERHTWRSEAVAEAAAGLGSRRGMQMPAAVRMEDRAVPAVMNDTSMGQGLADMQFPSDFELDFRQFAPPPNGPPAVEQDRPALHVHGPNSGVPFDHQFVLNAGTEHEDAKLQMQRGASEHRTDSEQELLLRDSAALATADFQQGYPIGNHPIPTSGSFQRVTPGSFPLPGPPSSQGGPLFSPPRSPREQLLSGASNRGMRVGDGDVEFEVQPDETGIPTSGRTSPTRPHNAYGSGMFPMPLAGGGAAMPGRRLPGNLVPGVVHGLMPIEALGVVGVEPPRSISERTPDLPALPEHQTVSHDTAELTSAAVYPPNAQRPGSVNMPSSARMGRVADGLFSQGGASVAPMSGVSQDMWHTAQEGFPDVEVSGNGSVSQPSSLANSQPGQCGFPLRMCN